ncbi:MAG: hypothetical protein U0798_21350 [Gemmataceae bacterium]
MIFENVPWFVWVIVFFFSISLATFLLTSIAYMLEKRPIKPYTENVNPELSSTRLADRFCNMFEKNRFELHQIVKDNRGGIYQILYQFYRSANGDCIAIVANGTLMKISLDICLIATRFDDGTWIKTVSHPNGSEQDLTGMVREAVYEKLSPQEFLDKHDDRIERESKSKTVLPYDKDEPMIDYCSDLLRRVDSLVSKGLAKFRDEERTVWSYTFLGAVRLASRMCLTAMRRNYVKDR